MSVTDLAPAPTATTSFADLVQAGAESGEKFSYTFFPRTFRQPPAQMHTEVWNVLDGEDRYVNLQLPRGFAKTSILRTYVARRIAYGLSHTILYIGRSEGHAIRSSSWLRGQLEHNRLYTTAFNLRPGSKVQDTELQIWHGTDQYPIWLLSTGITGSTRGINRDDFRPDTIICDDILDDENCLTKEQRQKFSNLLYGAIMASLAPESEFPDAKLVMLQTPLHQEDASTLALKDSMWRSLRFSCWTRETEDLPVDQQESAWPERYPSETLRKLKRSYIAQNNVSVFAREYECKLVAPETCVFRSEWLKYYDEAPEYGSRVLAIDPVPPPSPLQVEKNLHDKDYECLMVMQRTGNDYYVLDYVANRGHNPDWTIAQFFTLAMRYNPQTIAVEAVAYQRTLSWLLQRAMEQHGRFWAIRDTPDNRPKYLRIVDALKGIASGGHLYVKRSHTELISQFTLYRNVEHDDVIECAAMCATELNSTTHDYMQSGDAFDERDIPPLRYALGAP